MTETAAPPEPPKPRNVYPPVGSARARKANAVLRGDAAGAARADEDLRLARAEQSVARIAEAAPPFSAEQRARLAVLLLAPGGGG